MTGFIRISGSRTSNTKNPTAKTEEMTKYRRSHRECEWSDCDQTKSLHVHHVLPQHKYPEYVDGDYHGRIGNNFICYCPFHHFAYHNAYATKRNDKRHKNPTRLLWWQVLQWADDNKISIEDLESVNRAIRVSLAREEEALMHHLPFLANVGSVSPYIGLFGTVWGIINSFQGLSDATQATINAVAPGISEALVATALGLFAAIPAVVAYNRFASESDSQLQQSSVFGEELASILYRQTVKVKN